MPTKKDFLSSCLLIGFLAVFACVGISTAQEVLFEGFEDAGTFPPTGWLHIPVNSGVHTWHQDSPGYDGSSYCASCEYMIGTWYQEEFLQTPVLDLSGSDDVTLSFWFKGSYTNSVTTNGCDLKVQISTDGGATYPVTLWSDDTADPFNDDEWTYVELSLNDYRVPNVAIWWRYTGSTVHQGDEFSIDHIQVDAVHAVNPAIHVTNLLNDGEGSLRWAIDSANTAPGEDSILFDVSGIIELTEALPSITDDDLKIMGTSAPGGSRSVILDGTNAPSDANGLNILANQCQVDGLVIQSFNNGIFGSFLGARSLLEDNLISGCTGYGVLVNGDGSETYEGGLLAEYNTIFNNAVGGICLSDASGHPMWYNIIYGNGGNGITVENDSWYNSFVENLIYDNAGLGIDLGNDGPTPNDEGDGDSGPNDLLNYPVIDSITSITGLPYTIYGHAGPEDLIHFYVAKTHDNPAETEDPSGHGEAYSFLGRIQADINGDFVFVPDGTLTELSIITCTARGTEDEKVTTSEFSLNVVYTPKADTEPISITTLDDSGPGSLRDAIDQANTHIGEDTLVFDIDGTIVLATALPELTDDATAILGSTAPGGIHAVMIDASALTTGNGFLINSSDNYIEGLVITGAPEDGIKIQDASAVNNTLTANHIYDNGELAIDLVDPGDVSPGVTLNDVGDGDAGPNGLINYPEIDSIRSTFYFTDFFVWGEAVPDATIEFYSVYLIESGVLIEDWTDASLHGEGKYIGSTVCDGTGRFYYPVPVTIDEYSRLTAITIDSDGNTSEMGENFDLIPRPLFVKGITTLGSKSDCPSAIDLRIIDPNGSMIGYDLSGTFYEEIPDAEYHESAACDDSIFILNPIAGSYVIEVVADRNYSPQSGDNPMYTVEMLLGGGELTTLAESVTLPEGTVDSCSCFVGFVTFLCGDANGDEEVNIGDAVFIINYVFRSGAAPDPLEAGDANCDGQTNIGDAVYIISYIFRDGSEPCANCP